MNTQFSRLQEAIRNVNQQHEQTEESFWQAAWNHLADEMPQSQQTDLKLAKLTHNEMQILSQLNNTSAELVPYKELLILMPFSQGLFSRYVNRLAKASLIEKSKKADNKKAVQLSITETGRYAAKLHDEMHRVEIASYEKSLSNFDSEEIETAIRVLSQLSE